MAHILPVCFNKGMEIKSALFMKGIIGTDPILKDGIPHVAFIGRSNVGKSSVINSLLGKKELVKSSSVPGKTKEINFFKINNSAYFVDLPGYGFARMGARGADKIRKLILWYLTGGEARPSLVVLIVDAGAGPMAHDKEMVNLLRLENLDFIIIANKIDRLTQAEKVSHVRAIEQELMAPVFPYSARTKFGKEELLATISESCT